jgi:hypothetical protein
VIAILGDIHGDVTFLWDAVVQAQEAKATALIQVGDFGLYDGMPRYLEQQRFPLPLYIIDGNHENHDLLNLKPGTYEFGWGSEAYFVGRGTTLHLDGRQVGFLGGADSIDKRTRLMMGWHWSAREVITPDDALPLLGCESLDLFVTHTPPQSVIDAEFDPQDMLRFGVPLTWKGESSILMDRVWKALRFPPMYCGHMHRSVTHGRCRILAEGEVVFV